MSKKTNSLLLAGGLGLAAILVLPKLLNKGSNNTTTVIPPQVQVPQNASATWLSILNSVLAAGGNIITAWIQANAQSGESHPTPQNLSGGNYQGTYENVAGIGRCFDDSCRPQIVYRPMGSPMDQRPRTIWLNPRKHSGFGAITDSHLKRFSEGMMI